MISIIVPIYKAESFIVRCVDSILNQTYQDWELLLVDDGSPDKSGKICDDYAAKDARIQVFHKSNGGVSSARNLGLDNAKGEWITFVDADDYLLPEFLSRLIEKNDCDLVMSGSRRFGDSNDTLLIPEEREYDIQTFVENIFKCDPLENDYMCCVSYPWGKILRADIIREHHLTFNTQMKLSEDTCFILQYLEYVDKVKYIAGGDYMYYVSSGPKAHLRMTAEEYNIHRDAFQVCLNRVVKLYKVDTAFYMSRIVSMYFGAFMSYLKSCDYRIICRQYDVFISPNRQDIAYIVNSTSRARSCLLRLAFFNHLLFYYYVIKFA